jgi:mRNA-degrading endonuclease RelE of RelBE toxin-antitoxin system
MAYEIRFAGSVKEQIRRLAGSQRARVLEAVEKQLSHEPLVESRNRKPLRQNPLAPWELRVGDLRVFYEVAEDENEVQVLAVGEKRGNSLWIAGEEVKL